MKAGKREHVVGHRVRAPKLPGELSVKGIGEQDHYAGCSFNRKERASEHFPGECPDKAQQPRRFGNTADQKHVEQVLVGMLDIRP